ncbi:hypothetical protein ABW20_dc0100485 [Dactylellina cionopaga]|nr:hypothetical protein ABW20_dc0100485 [Dactylellina cionopaga]
MQLLETTNQEHPGAITPQDHGAPNIKNLELEVGIHSLAAAKPVAALDMPPWIATEEIRTLNELAFEVSAEDVALSRIILRLMEMLPA